MPHLMIRRELEFGNFKFQSGGEGVWERRKTNKKCLGGCPIREVFLRETSPHRPSIQIGNGRLLKFLHAIMRQLLLQSILLSYFTSEIFLFLANKSKRTTSNLKYLKRQKVGRGHLIFIFRGEFPMRVIRGMLIPIYTLWIQNIKF